jgi:hypothetical protein
MFISVGDVSIQISHITHIRKSGDSLIVYFSGGEHVDIPAENVEAFWTKMISAESNRSLRIE